MPESESPQEPKQSYFHKKIPSIFGKLSVLKSPETPPDPGKPSSPPAISPQNILVGLLFGVVVLIGVSSTTAFYLKFRQAEKQRKYNEEQVNVYRKSILEIQKETQAKMGGADIDRLKSELEEAKKTAKNSEGERNLLAKKVEDSITELKKEKTAKEDLQKNLQEREKIRDSLQEQINQLKLENFQFQEKIKNFKVGGLSNLGLKESGQAHITVVKPEAKIGVIDSGSQAGISPKMIMVIYDENNQKVGEFVVDEVEEFFAAGKIITQDIRKIKPGMRVCRE